jgi:hypothetical protein
MHIIAALITSPLALFEIDPVMRLHIFILLLLTIPTVALYIYCRNHLPHIKTSVLLLSCLLFQTSTIFPWYPLHEGGISRIAGHIAALVYILFFLNTPSLKKVAITIGLIIPALFLIHPSAVLLPCLIVTWHLLKTFKTEHRTPKTLGLSLTLTALSTIIGLSLILLFTYSSPSAINITNKGINQSYILEWNFSSLFDRFKGPVHYLLADRNHPGKFFSLHSLCALAGLFILLTKKRIEFAQYRLIALTSLLLPFIAASLAFFSNPVSQNISMLFYHSIERMTEPAALGLFFLWLTCINEVAMCKRKPILISLTVALIAYSTFSFAKIKHFIDVGNQRFNSMTYNEVISAKNELLEKAKTIPDNSLLLFNSRQHQILYSYPEISKKYKLLFINGAECGGNRLLLDNTQYCENIKKMFLSPSKKQLTSFCDYL